MLDTSKLSTVPFELCPPEFQAKRPELRGMGVEFKGIGAGEFKADRAKRRVEGYFSRWTIDQGRDVIEKGFFAESITRDLPAKLIKHFFNHTFALGKALVVEEQSEGLYCVGDVTDHPQFDPYLAEIENETAAHGSIGFTVKERQRFIPEGDTAPARRLVKGRLYEFSPVYWPMHEGTSAALAKAAGMGGEAFERKSGLSALATILHCLDTYFWYLENGPWLTDDEGALVRDVVAQIEGLAAKARALHPEAQPIAAEIAAAPIDPHLFDIARSVAELADITRSL